MQRKIIAIVLVLLLLLAPATTVFGATADQQDKAEKLNKLGVLRGTSPTSLNFELDRQPTRVEAIMMMLRLLGREGAAETANFNCPFTDVPQWAQPYVAYAYHVGYTKGIGNGKFGSDIKIPANQYTTIVLRVLFYSDDHGQFEWDKSLTFARQINMFNTEQYNRFSTTTFTRGSMVEVTWQGLKSQMYNLPLSLTEHLVYEMKSINEQSAKEVGLI